jgi:hypothetical protein
MRTQALLATAIGLLGMPALAQERPMMQPTRDVMVEYHVAGGSEGQPRANTVRMYFTDRGSKLRIEPVGQPGYSIMDRSAGRMIIVMAPQRMYMEMPYDAKQVMSFDNKDATFTRRGTDNVAGIRCTVFDGKSQEHSGQVCVSDDGVMLRAKSDPGSPGGSLEATSVTYGPQSASLFAPPADFQKMDTSHLPQGMGPPGGRPPGR